jgi:transcriptional regulator with GAF, ATPase, and Fis domain
LPDCIAGYASASLSGAIGRGAANFSPEGTNFEKEIATAERRDLLAVLEKSERVRTKVAEPLGITQRSFRHYAKKLKVS